MDEKAPACCGRTLARGCQWHGMERWPKARSCTKFSRDDRANHNWDHLETVSAMSTGPWKDITEAVCDPHRDVARHFQISACAIAIEVGTHSRWVSQLLGSGVTSDLANPRNLRMIATAFASRTKSMRTCSPGSHVSIRTALSDRASETGNLP